MSSSVSNLQLLNNTEHRVKFKTGSDINNVEDAVPGELFLEKPDPLTKGSVLPNKHSLNLDASSNQYATISNLELSGAFTISMWVNWTSSFDGAPYFSMDPLFYKDYESTGTTDIGLNKGNGRLRFSVYDRNQTWGNGHLTAQASFSPSFGTWYHIMVTHSGETNPSISNTGFDTALKIFVDGTELVSVKDFHQDFDGMNSPASTTAYLGRAILNNRYFNGKIDQVAIWNSDQSANITSIYTSKNPNDLSLIPNSPDHWFKLSNNTANSTGSSTLDLIGSPNFSTDVSLDTETLPYNKLYTCTDLGVKKLDGQTRVETNYTFGGGIFSLSTWIKTTKDKFIIATDSQVGGGETSFAIGFKDPTTPYILIGNPGQQIHQSGVASNPINDGQWHHIGVSINASYEMSFSVDGVVETTHTFTTLPGSGDHLVHYGAGWSDGTPPIYDTWGVEGELTNLAIWETAILDTHWQFFYNAGPYSEITSSFNPDELSLWINPNNEIRKITDLTAKMGDVPMLKANANVFTRTSSVSSSGAGSSYSFWFYDDGTETGSQTIFKNSTTHNSHVVVNHDSSTIQFHKHAHSNNIIINNPLIASAITHGYELTYEKNKLNNFLFTKQGADPYFTKLYLNGELVASSDQNVSYYPSDLFKEINPKMTNGEEREFSLLLGDVAYWDADVSDISDEVYSPNQGHKGYQGDWGNISTPPKHYWKLSAPMESGQVKDIGTDGTNHFTTTQPLEETYTTSVYADQNYLFYPQDGAMHGLSNGKSNPYGPEMFMFAGDTMNITRPDSSHPLHIKDSSGNDVASSVDQGDGTYKTTFSPTIAGTYQYYSTSDSSIDGDIHVLKRAGYENIFGIQNS